MKPFFNKRTLNEDNERLDNLSIQDIESGRGMPTLSRLAFTKDIESIFKYGYSREWEGSAGGHWYGPGVYCNFLLSDTINNLIDKKGLYGDAITLMKLVGGYNGFIIFDKNIAQQTYGQKWRIKDQLINVARFDVRKAEEVEQELNYRVSSLYHGRTAPAAKAFWEKYKDDLYKKYNIRGLVYTGANDGHCTLVYDFTSVIPYSVSFDGGKTFQKKFNEEMFNHLRDHADVNR